MNKRIIFIVMMLVLTLSLAACNSSDDNIASIVVNNPYGENGEKVVFDFDEQNQIVFKGDKGLSYWTINEAGIATLVTYDGDLPTLFEENNGVRTYYFIRISINFLNLVVDYKKEIFIWQAVSLQKTSYLK